MDKIKLGGIGIILAFLAGVIAVAGIFVGLGVLVAGYGLGLVGSILFMLGAFELSKRFGTPLFQIGGILLLVGNLASLAAAVAVLGTLSSGNLLGLAGALGTIALVALISAIGWILVGVGFIARKAQVAQALGAGQETFVLLTGIFLVLVIVPLANLLSLIGMIFLIIIFFRLAKGAAPAAPAA